MRTELLVTAFGEDRPGIVAQLTQEFVKHAANVQESRMAILGGEFAAIILVSIPQGEADALRNALSRLKHEGITVTTKETQSPDIDTFKEHTAFKLVVSGADHEGIVHTVSKFLRDRSINIQSAETDIVHAPETGTPLFRMRAQVLAPPSITLSQLQGDLNIVGDEERVDVIVSSCSDNTN